MVSGKSCDRKSCCVIAEVITESKRVRRNESLIVVIQFVKKYKRNHHEDNFS
jgi:hypothetical protein